MAKKVPIVQATFYNNNTKQIENCYPMTSAKGVVMSDGKTLEESFSDKADNSVVVHKSGDEEILGRKTFETVRASSLDLSDEGDWNRWVSAFYSFLEGQGIIQFGTEEDWSVILRNIADPEYENDAATKGYVDIKIGDASFPVLQYGALINNNIPSVFEREEQAIANAPIYAKILSGEVQFFAAKIGGVGLFVSRSISSNKSSFELIGLDFKNLAEILITINIDQSGLTQAVTLSKNLQSVLTDTDGGYGQRVAELEKTKQDILTPGNGISIEGGVISSSVAEVVDNIVNAGYVFAGVATPSTNPGTPDAKVFYIANGKGTYANFGGLGVTEDEVVVLIWDSSWHKVATGIASQEKLTELDEKINGKIVPPLSVGFPYAQGTNISENNKFPFFIKGGESQTLLISGESSHFSSGSIYIYFYDENDIEVLHFSKPIGVEWNWTFPRNVSKIALYKPASQVLGSGTLSVSLPYSGYNDPGLSEEVEEIKSDILTSIKGEVDENKQDLSNIKKDLYGIVIDKEIEAASSTNGKYVNATNSGAITEGSSSSAIAFYPIEKDKTYHIEIPKVGNSATYVFSFADTIMDTGYVPHHLDIIGNSQPLSIDIVAPNYAYLIIDYAYASGMPVVTLKVEGNRVFAKLTEIPQIPENKRSLKILYFGNSFTQDSVGYMPFILKGLDENIELTVGIAYTGGASLQRHCANILNQAIGDVSPSNYTYYNKYANGAEKWISSSNVSAATILADEEWDVVTFQQSSDLAASEFNTYIAPYIYKIEHYLSSYFHTKPIKTGWLLTQSRGNDSESRLSNYNGVAVTARKVMELTSSAFLIPYGTAVQNLRSIPSLDALGVGGGMSYDGQHLQEGIGCLVAAYTHTLVCLQLLGIQNRSILGENTRPNESWIIDKAIPLPNWDDSHTVIGITDSNCYLAQMAANLAIKKMFEVTDMSGIDSFVE